MCFLIWKSSLIYFKLLFIHLISGGIPVSISGDGLIQDINRAGFYNVRYGLGMPMQGTQVTVVDTDYNEYALIYSCTNSLLSGLFHSGKYE